MELSYKDIDWRSALVRRYKAYGLDEVDLAVILSIYEETKEDDVFLSSDELVSYMVAKKDVIDSSLVKLINKKLITYINRDNSTVISLAPLFSKLVIDVKKDIVLDSKDSSKEKNKDLVNTLYTYFETEMGKSLSSREVDRIAFWLKQDISENMIHECVEKLKDQRKRVSITAVDKLLLKMQKQDDIKKEGFSPRSEDWDKGSEETLRIISEPWVK